MLMNKDEITKKIYIHRHENKINMRIETARVCRLYIYTHKTTLLEEGFYFILFFIFFVSVVVWCDII